METLTTCTLDCPDRCSLVCRVRGDGSLHLEGNPDHPYTRGFTCRKIQRYPQRLHSPHRIREPWLRQGDRFAAVSWETALDVVCEALEGARRRGPGRVLAVRGAGNMGLSKGYTDYVLASLGARATVGSLCDAAGCAAVEADAGALRMNDPLEIDNAEAVVLWGKNPRASSIHTAEQVVRARQRGVPVFAVNPDSSAVADLADRVLSPAPGTDRFLALAAAALVLARPNRPVPWHLCSNRERFEWLLAEHPVDDLLQRCGVGPADAEALANLYRATPRVATLVGWGLQRYTHGAETVRALHALAFVAGTVGVPGGGLYYSVPSSRHWSRPTAPQPGAPPLVLPRLASEIPAARPPVELAWFSCINFANQGPDAKATRATLRTIPSVVAVEAFWTETARQATVVLPPTLWLEEDDLVASYWHRGVGAARRVVEPPEGCRGDFDIVGEVARRLGLPTPFATRHDWLSRHLPPEGPTLEQLFEAGHWLSDEPRVAWADGFAHPDGRFRFLDTLSPLAPAEAHHPLALLTLVRTDALHSQLLPEEQKNPLAIRLHPETARRAGLASGNGARVVSAHGELEGEIHLDPGLHPGAVAVPRGGWLNLGQGVNEVTGAHVTDLGQGAAYYETRVRVESASPTP